MASEKDAARQDNGEEDDDSSEDFPKGDEEIDEKKSTSLTGVLNAKIAALAIASLVIGILVGQVALPGLGVGLVSLPSSDCSNGSDNVDLAALQAKVQDYLQANIMEPQGLEAEVKSVESYNESFYAVDFTVSDGTQTQDATVYLTKDGLALVGNQPLMLDEPLPEAQQQPAQQEEQPAELQTSDKPTVELFIMSYCPYGLQMQKAMLPVMELLGDKADFSVKFVYYVMHDLKEIEENTRQYCIQKEQQGKFVNYSKCFTASGDSTACLASTGLDITKLNACTAAADTQFGITAAYQDKASWLSSAYPIYPVDFALNQQYGVQGSPTLVVNGVKVQANRSPEAVKQAVCDAFNNAPEACSQVLSTASASSGFGADAGSTSEGGCGV